MGLWHSKASLDDGRDAVTVVLSNLKILSLLCLSSPCKEIMGLWKEWWIENLLTEFRILA